MRERDFSLGLRAIRPSEFVGTRRKVALRIEAYAWAPVLRVFNKLPEVGDLSYLVYFHFKCFDRCFSWVEALNDRLIGPKTWDRIVRIFLSHLDSPQTVCGRCGLLGCE